LAEDGKIIYKVEVNSDDAVSEAKRGGERAGQALSESAERHGGKFEQVMIGAARRIGEAFVDMAERAVKGVEQIAQAGVEFNAKMETYQTAFTTLLGTEEEAARVMEQIRKDAAATPFDVDSLTQANQMLIAAGVSAGDARNDVLSLANAIAATGGGSAELSRMAANMQQIKNVGKATAMDIRQFANAGINIYGLLADYTGKTVKEVSELDVSYEMLAGALAHASAEGGKYAGALEKQSQTFTGRISTLKDNATQLAGALTEDLFNTLSGEALPKVMEWVSTLLEAAQTGGLDGALSASKTILGGLVQSFLEGLPQMLDTGLNLLTGLLEGIASAIPEIIPVITQVIIAIITALATHLPEILTAGMDILTGIVTGLINAMPLIVQAVPQIIAALVTAIINNLPQIITAGINLLVALIKGVLTALL
jgi:tape measure domain-containing protein